MSCGRRGTPLMTPTTHSVRARVLGTMLLRFASILFLASCFLLRLAAVPVTVPIAPVILGRSLADSVPFHAAKPKRSCRTHALTTVINTWSFATREPSSIVFKLSRRPMTFF